MTTTIEEENQKLAAKSVIVLPKTQFPPFISQIYLDPSSTYMDLDFTDLDSSWPFDQIPTSPFLLSTSDQTYSPLWAFADADVPVDDNRNIKGSVDFSRISTCNLLPEPASANTRQEEEGEDTYDKNKRKLPTPFIGLGLDNLDVSFVIKERMTQALRNFKESTDQTQILAQIWAPVKDGNRNVLTTSGQPFVLGHHTNGLHQYRTVSLMYMFSVDGEINGTLGLPGRVFRQKLPEWTPNVQYYSSKEYPRVNHAKHCNVRGTLALPVFEPSGQACVGVLELIMTSEKINYAPEVDKVCRALEAVNLRSSKILDHPNIQICNEGRQHALSEILEVLTEVCETYKLPLAQTWIPCMHRSVLAYGGGFKKSCSSFDGSCMGQVCMSTTDVALYVVDAHMWGFRDACAEHHLQKGQGVVGRAFSSHGLCFCQNISLFRKIEYPLVHYARMFRLTSSFAICLRSKHTGDDDYVLEFFLPSSITNTSEQIELLDSILMTMKNDLQNLVVASGRTLEEERKLMEIVEVFMDENPDLQVESNLSTNPMATSDAVRGVVLPRVNLQTQFVVETDPGKTVAISRVESKEMKKTSERKRGKAEKQISLEVLQQYFAGSLKEAAKSLGVCPTTMKRICRQHGISRWPSRKINKVNRSLTKLKRVIESVQGTDGTFTLTSLAPPTMPVGVGPSSWPPTDLPDETSELPVGNPKPNGLTIGWTSSPEERIHEQYEFGSREVSTSTSHGSCYGSPGAESNPPNPGFRQNGDPPFPSGYSMMPDTFLRTHPRESFGGMPIDDVGSSKDLSNVGPLSTSAIGMVPRFTPRQDVNTLTIKATYREDIIRFRFSLSSNIVELKEEVAKRFKLEVGTFEMKYLDDDHEWVLIACDSDLQECLDIAKSSGSNMVRLLVQEISGHVGSSCESSGEKYGF